MSFPISSYTLRYRSKDGKHIKTKCILTKPLAGRGHPCEAGFYREIPSRLDRDSHEYLIKADAAGICLAESTATDAFLTTECINCAHIGYLNGMMVSIQKRIKVHIGESLIGLDEFVYGRKRDPSTWWSEESRHSLEILATLLSLTKQAKNDIAQALFASTALGDESIHLGQFMAITSGSTHEMRILRIIRVDFGARERFSKKRFEKFDFHPTKTSKYYAMSGQLKKDYISYFLADLSLKKEFLSLWATADVEAIVQAQIDKFREQLSIIKDDQKEIALKEFLTEFNREAKLPILLDEHATLDQNIKHFLLAYEEVIRSRCSHMHKEAKEELSEMIKQERLEEALVALQGQVSHEKLKSTHDGVELTRPGKSALSLNSFYLGTCNKLLAPQNIKTSIEDDSSSDSTAKLFSTPS